MPKKAHHEEHENLEAWVIPYADLLTLLLAMFLALYATSNTDLQKLKEFASAFRSEVKGGPSDVVDPGIKKGKANSDLLNMGGQALLDGSGLAWPANQLVQEVNAAVKSAGDKALDTQNAQLTADAVNKTALDNTKTSIEKALQGTGFDGKFQFKQDEVGLHIVLLTDGVLFTSGSAKLSPEAGNVLPALGAALKNIDNKIKIIGHTDSAGSVAQNDTLSSERAISMKDYLVTVFGLDPKRIEFSGKGSTDPIADNGTPEGRAKNRRVEILIESKISTPAGTTPTGTTTQGGQTHG